METIMEMLVLRHQSWRATCNPRYTCSCSGSNRSSFSSAQLLQHGRCQEARRPSSKTLADMVKFVKVAERVQKTLQEKALLGEPNS